MHTQGNLPITEPGLSHTDSGACTPRQLSRACFLHKMDMERIWTVYAQWDRKIYSSYPRYETWKLLHREAWIALYGFNGNKPSVPTGGN